MSEPISFRCKGFRWPFWLSIVLLLNFSMIIMFLTFSIGLPPFLSVAVLLLSMVFGIGVTGAHTEYSITSEGIAQELRPLQWSLIKLPPARRFFKWDEIKSYRAGEDLSRGLQRYHYLYISVSKFPYQLRLSDHQASKEALAVFEAAFQSVIETGVVGPTAVTKNLPGFEKVREDTQTHAHSSTPLTYHDDSSGSALPVRRKPDFYHSRRAHVLFWFFAAVFATIGYQLIITGNTNLTNYWRMAVVVVPGMSYFAWRLYGRQRPK